MIPKVEELTILAAPSCCGKTYFLEQLQTGRLGHLSESMGFELPFDSYVSIIPKQLPEYHGAQIPKMIFHFALPTLAINDGSLKNLADEPRLAIVASATRIRVVTLVASSETLLDRLRLRYRANRRMMFFRPSNYLSERRRLKQLKQTYAHPSCVARTYDAWLQYVSELPNVAYQYLVGVNSSYRVYPGQEWHRIREEYFPGSN